MDNKTIKSILFYLILINLFVSIHSFIASILAPELDYIKTIVGLTLSITVVMLAFETYIIGVLNKYLTFVLIAFFLFDATILAYIYANHIIGTKVLLCAILYATAIIFYYYYKAIKTRRIK